MKILVIEDDQSLVHLLSEQLRQDYLVEVVEDGLIGLEYGRKSNSDLLIIDVELPRLNGFEICQMLREEGIQSPILLLSARSQERDKVQGLALGADDYLVKPFRMPELMARVQALLRRPPVRMGSHLRWGELCLDPGMVTVTYRHQAVDLRPKEYKLLEILLRQGQRLSTHDQLLDQLWTYEEVGSRDALKAHIKGLRKALARVGVPPDWIQSIRGMGILLNPVYGDSTTDQPVEETTDPQRPSFPPFPDEGEETSVSVLPQLQAVWPDFQQLFQDRVRVIGSTLQQWQTGTGSETDRHKAHAAAHALAGSLGVFGLHQGTQWAQELEDALLDRIESRPLPPGLLDTIRRLDQIIAQDPMVMDSKGRDSLAPQNVQVLGLGLDAQAAQALSSITEQMGIQIVMAASLAEAQMILDRTSIDVMVLDWEDPSLQGAGISLAHQVGIPVVGYLRQDGLGERIRAQKLGTTGVLAPPLHSEWVTQTLRRVIGQPTGSAARLLVVEDDPVCLDRLKNALHPHYQLTLLKDPQDFWQILQERQPQICLLDVRLPHFSGLELCQAIRSDCRFDQTPVVLLTGYPSDVDRAVALELGATDYLSKSEYLGHTNQDRLLRTRLAQHLRAFSTAF